MAHVGSSIDPPIDEEALAWEAEHLWRAALGLIDEYRLLIHPVTLGSGKPCIAVSFTLRIVSCRQFESGVVALTYSRPGERTTPA